VNLVNQIVDALLSPDEHGTSWAGEVVYHGTGRAHASAITKHLEIQPTGGYFGNAFYVADSPKLAKNAYADVSDDEPVVLMFRINENAKILDLREEDAWERWAKLANMIYRSDCSEQMVKAGVDGIYDRSVGGLAIYNPKVITFLGEWPGDNVEPLTGR
jgi:hypothetical protein